jgi:hypothetical protein
MPRSQTAKYQVGAKDAARLASATTESCDTSPYHLLVLTYYVDKCYYEVRCRDPGQSSYGAYLLPLS